MTSCTILFKHFLIGIFCFLTFSTNPVKASSLVATQKEECTHEDLDKKIQAHLYPEYSFEVKRKIENSKPFFYRVFKNDCPLEVYCLGTYHRQPIGFLPKRVKKIIEKLYKNPRTIAVSEVGSYTIKDFNDDMNKCYLEYYKKIKRENSSIILNIPRTLEQEKEYLIRIIRGIYVKEEKKCEIIVWKKRLTEILQKYQKLLENGWVNDPSLKHYFDLIFQEEPKREEITKELETFSLRYFYELMNRAKIEKENKYNAMDYLMGMDYLMTDMFSKKHTFFALDSISLKDNAKVKEITKKIEETSPENYIPVEILMGYIKNGLQFILEQSEQKFKYIPPLDISPPLFLESSTPVEFFLKGLHFNDLGDKSLHVQIRNKAWEGKILEILKKDAPTFFFFGAGHLNAECGIINLLKKSGYELRRINNEGTFTL